MDRPRKSHDRLAQGAAPQTSFRSLSRGSKGIPYSSTDAEPASHLQSSNSERLSFEEDSVGNGGLRRMRSVDRRVDDVRQHDVWDVMALIINKMIGTGIFTTPALVLQLTRSKSVAIGLWSVGFFYTILSSLLYIEYSRKLPFNGGELLDHAFPNPRLLGYTMYTFFFVFTYNSTTNYLQFARWILESAHEQPQDSQRVLRFIAVVTATCVALMLFVSTSTSKLVNKTIAASKVILLAGVFFAGIAYAGKNRTSYDWNQRISGTQNWPLALLYIAFSFDGWENATLVAGQVVSFKVLRKGFLWAVCIVGMLYLMVTIVLCAAFQWTDSADPLDSVPLNYLALYLGNSEAAKVAAAIIIALSALGSIVSIDFTSVRVKQNIGWANILPWSSLWRRHGPVHPEYEWHRSSRAAVGSLHEQQLVFKIDLRAMSRPGSPEGGILLHWIATIFYICVTAAIGNVLDAINYSGTLLVLGHLYMEGLVAFFYIYGFKPWTGHGYIPARRWHDSRTNGASPKWLRPADNSRQRKHRWRAWLSPDGALALFVVLFAIVVTASSFVEQENRRIQYTFLGFEVLGIIYWLFFVRSRGDGAVPSRRFGLSFSVRTHGDDDAEDAVRACDWCTARAPSKESHRHPLESYEAYNHVTLEPDAGYLPRLLYGTFGGTYEGVWRDLWQDLLSARWARRG